MSLVVGSSYVKAVNWMAAQVRIQRKNHKVLSDSVNKANQLHFDKPKRFIVDGKTYEYGDVEQPEHGGVKTHTIEADVSEFSPRQIIVDGKKYEYGDVETFQADASEFSPHQSVAHDDDKTEFIAGGKTYEYGDVETGFRSKCDDLQLNFEKLKESIINEIKQSTTDEIKHLEQSMTEMMGKMTETIQGLYLHVFQRQGAALEAMAKTQEGHEQAIHTMKKAQVRTWENVERHEDVLKTIMEKLKRWDNEFRQRFVQIDEMKDELNDQLEVRKDRRKGWKR